jgi:hypothetical protein
MTSETSFVEEGEIAFDGGACGWALPAQELRALRAEEGTLRGAVIWQVEGWGRLSGATGLCRRTSCSNPIVAAQWSIRSSALPALTPGPWPTRGRRPCNAGKGVRRPAPKDGHDRLPAAARRIAAATCCGSSTCT